MLLKSEDQLKQTSINSSKTLLIIYDLQKKKAVKIFDTIGYKRFVLIGDFLIFDKGIDKDSHIEIFKLESLSVHKTIKVTGGCGLSNI